MGKRKRAGRQAQQAPTGGGGEAFSGGFGALLQAKGLQRSEAAKPPAAKTPAPAGRPGDTGLVASAQRWIVRISKKGRGGREATLMEPRGLPSGTDLGPLARRLRKELGCGAKPEGNAIAVQGDQRERLEEWLGREGARKVTQG